MTKRTLTVTSDQLVAALTEWERRSREDPAKFMTDSEKLAESAESYGEACASYLVSILDEQAA